MAPNKRRRTLEDDGEPERSDDGSEAPSSRQRSTQRNNANRKKSRISRAHENGGSAVSDEESEGEPVEDEQNGEPAEDSDGDEDEDTVRERVLMQLEEDADGGDILNTSKINRPADHGVIEEVFCQNFMCHTRLRIKLGPLINFIIGHNGSGKSAVLTALTLCLGAKATVTNRGGSLKNFIKEGTDSAMVSVKIKNQGEAAFQHDLYGNTVVVERHFSRTGSSGFKLKNEDGRIITTKKSDLEDMLDYFSLQLDNPMNVLSQDLARQFLNSSTPHDKYKFFLKGTQLEQLDRDYRTMHEYVDQTELKLERRLQDISHLEKRLRDAERKKKEAEQAENIAERIRDLDRMHAWSQVKEQEIELEKATAAVEKVEEEIARVEKDAEEKSRTYAERDAEVEAAKNHKIGLQEQLQPAEDNKSAIKDKFDTNKKLLLDLKSTQRNIVSDRNDARNRKRQAEENISKEEERIQQASGPAQAQKLEELREAEEDVVQKRAAQEAQGDKRALENRRAEIEGKKRSEEEARLAIVLKAKEEKKAAESVIQQLRNEAGQRTRAYHQSLGDLQRLIQHESRFKEKPIGPLGMHVKLKKPDWSSVIESVFGGVLNSFVVTNAHDSGVLRGLINRASYHGDIFIGNPRPLDVSKNKANTKYDTLLDVLDVDHDIVRNQFIINQQAERTVLIPDRNEAADFIANKPANVAVALAMDRNRRGAGHRFSYGTNGSRMDPVQPFRGLARMQTNVEAQIAAQRSNIADAERRINSDRDKIVQLEQELKEVNQAINSFNHRGRELRIARQEAETKVERIKEELEAFTIDAGTLDAHKNALTEAQGDLEIAENSYQDSVDERDALHEKQTKLKEELDGAQLQVDKLNKKLEKCAEIIRKKEAERSTALSNKNKALDKVEDTQGKKEEAEKLQKELDERVREWTGEAEKVCRRREVEEGMTPERIEKRLEALDKQKRDAEDRLGGSREEIHRRWRDADEAWSMAISNHNSLRAVSELLKKTTVARKQSWKKFRKYIMARAMIMFSLLLDQRKFRGEIKVNHEQRFMDIRVEPDTTRASNQGRQTKTLSGGEKSFSTICLLLSIWESMGSPIRCLDEFDVFMDNVNRDTSMRMMIQAARCAVGKQYILITPQAMNNIPIEEDMRIHKMSDPERGQTALPFGS
ncbi:AAA domain-containing protein 7 [Elsinoe fawcettii]|nr:AAA domain-containing protein 7 [Elsinoe fawcettii]